MNVTEKIKLDLEITKGYGATVSVGSDAYPYYVSEVLPNGIYGLYSPGSKFDDQHPWECGTMVVDPFDPERKSELYVKIRYGKWWEVERNGKPIRRFSCRYHTLRFGAACSYRNPSF